MGGTLIELSQLTLRTLLFLCLAFTVWVTLGTRQAFADSSTLTCTSLTSALSSDGNSYAFTVTASGNISSITGYTFDFGDHQSYSFQFEKKADQDHSRATVSHSYHSQGLYAATVYVDTEEDNNPASASSPSCHTTINNGPTALVDTGASNPFILFAVASLWGLSVSQVWLRCRRTRSP